MSYQDTTITAQRSFGLGVAEAISTCATVFGATLTFESMRSGSDRPYETVAEVVNSLFALTNLVGAACILYLSYKTEKNSKAESPSLIGRPVTNQGPQLMGSPSTYQLYLSGLVTWSIILAITNVVCAILPTNFFQGYPWNFSTVVFE